jgi:hypothetical protein
MIGKEKRVNEEGKKIVKNIPKLRLITNIATTSD